MKVTRRNVFETNSSSTHSITIAGGKEYKVDSLPLRDDGICWVYPGEFGWETESYNDAVTKASYALTWAKSYGEAEAVDMLRDVIAKETGTKVKFVRSSDDEYHAWGYIDHQSDDAAKDAFKSSEALRDFIFNPASELRTDNDNH